MSDKPSGGLFTGLFGGTQASARALEKYARVLAEEQKRQVEEDAARDSEPRKALRIRMKPDGSFTKTIVTLTDASAEQDRLAYAAWCESEFAKWTN